VSDKTYDEAAAALSAVKLGAAKADEFSDTIPVGKVIRTEPAIGKKAPRDSVVKVFVSKGPDLVVVPEFRLMTIDQANLAAAAAGVQLEVSGAFTPTKRVRAQDPPQGQKVKRGTAVTVFF
jgi:serine/threonine-protein kinase